MTRRAALGWLAAAGLSPGCSLRRDSRRVVRLANWGGASEDNEFTRTVARLHREFERRNPGVRLEVEKIPGSQEYATKLVFSHISRSMPESPVMDASSLATFAENGLLADLSQLEPGPDFAWDDFWPNVKGMFARGSAQYAAPIDFTPIVLYYNRAHFREAGIEPPRGAWSYDQFLAAAQELTQEGRFGLEMPNWIPGWITWLWNDGGDVLDPSGREGSGWFDGEASVRALQWIADLFLVHKVAPTLSEAEATGVDYFAKGKAAMQVSGHWELVGLQNASGIKMEDIGVMPVPSRSGGGSVTVMYGAGQSVAAQTKNPDDAWKFVQFWTGREAQEEYNASGIAVCGRLDVARSAAGRRPRYMEGKGTRDATDAEFAAHAVRERKFVEIVPSCRPPWGATVGDYVVVETICQKAMDKVLRNNIPVAAAARAAAQEIDRVLEPK